MSKVSVIVPVYNGARYIRNSLNSLVSQTHSDLEIIVVNDGSTDNTRAILRAIQVEDSRIRVIEHANKGVSASRNDALGVASGDYIAFMDADDRLLPNALESMLEIIEHEQVEIIRTMYLGSDSDFASKVVESYAGRYQGERQLSTVLNTITGGILPGYVWLLMYKNAGDLKTIRFDPSLSMMEDTLFYVQLLNVTDSIYISNLFTYEYTFNNASASRSLQRVQTNISDVMKLNAKFFHLLDTQEGDANNFSTNHANIIANMLFESFYFKPSSIVDIFAIVDDLSKEEASYQQIVKRAYISDLRPHLRYTINAIINRYKIRLLVIFITRSVYRKITGRSTL